MDAKRGRKALRQSLALSLFLCFILLGLIPLSSFSFAATISRPDDGPITVSTPHYRLEIWPKGFRYQFSRSNGEVIVRAHPEAGLEFAGGWVVSSKLVSRSSERLVFEVTNNAGQGAVVTIEPKEYYVRFGVAARKSGRIVARTSGVGPAFGLGDLGVRRRNTTELTGYVSEDFRGDGGQCGRLVSNFAIFPRQGFAEVNIEPNAKIVRLTAEENAQGSKNAPAMQDLYYFLGSPERIYASFLEVRNLRGWRVYPPKYEWFGLGWEAFGALAWDTNQKTVTENVNRYLSEGYPLTWMVVGSGFWPRHDAQFHATTSFGMWDTNLYPRPRELVDTFHQRGLKFFIGLRISFITNGPYASEGLKNGYFIHENGEAKVFRIAFPKSPCYLLDSTNPQAVQWYVGLCRKWMEQGIDGFKEDLFGYQKYTLRDDKLDPVNAALMEQGVYIMGRNGYLGSPMDIHRFEDFNFDQNQDRGPLNGLAFAYSGFPNVYPDIVGGTFGEGRTMPGFTDARLQAYIMRNAQYGSLNPVMAMGIGPWKFQSEQVSKVMLNAARLHAQLQPYIFSAAIDAAETGFPWTMTPLPLLWPEQSEVYQLENATRRGYQWMLGPSLLACPLYGNDYATATNRDVFLPPGKWMDYDTGEVYEGPRTLHGFALPVGKTPLFVGGKGILVLRDLESKGLVAKVYPVVSPGSEFRFVHPDGKSRSSFFVDADARGAAALGIREASGREVPFTMEPKTKALVFPLQPGHDYRVYPRPSK